MTASNQSGSHRLPVGHALPPELVESERIRRLRRDFSRLLMHHQFGINEMLTKVTILREEFVHMHRYNPIEHVSSRIKSPQSLLGKIRKRGLALDIDVIKANITDIAGIRITCSFIADTYRVLDALTAQDDIRVVEIKDYIKSPKPNGYKSLHAILEVPIFLTDGPVPVICEVQIRTIAMDFWASLEHKIHYKYDGAVPDHLVAELTQAAIAANELDLKMEQLNAEVHGSDTDDPDDRLDEEALRLLWSLSQQQE